jgi:acetyl esterase/lipase
MKRLLRPTCVACAVCAIAAPVAAAQPYSQESPPSGAYEGAAPRGYVVLIHGGGWKLVGRVMTGFMNPVADRLNQAGYATLNIDYGPGKRSLPDVLAFHDELRARVGSGTEICMYGDSAGGHLALLAAQWRPDVACVIANAAPTELDALPGGSGGLRRTARRLFGGPRALRAWSPAARKLKQPALLAYGKNDKVVPPDQGVRMLRRAPRAKIVRLRAGRAPWVHFTVSASDERRLYAAQLDLLQRVAPPPGYRWLGMSFTADTLKWRLTCTSTSVPSAFS